MASSGINHKEQTGESPNKSNNAGESKKVFQPKAASTISGNHPPRINSTTYESNSRTPKLQHDRHLEAFPQVLKGKETNERKVIEGNAKVSSQLEQEGDRSHHEEANFVADLDEISLGYPSDLPSDLFDIEGNLLYGNINHMKFDLEEDFSSCDDNEDSNHEESRMNPQRLTGLNDFNNKDEVKSFSNKASIHGASSSSQNDNQSYPNKKQYRSLCSSSSPSNKVTSISPTCVIPSKNIRQTPSLGKNKKETGSVTAGIENFSESDGDGNVACDVKRTGRNSRRGVIHKQGSTDDSIYHPLLINGSLSKKSFSPNFPALMTRRQLLSNQSSSGNTNNTSTTNSGNFSPPSDQFRSPIAPIDRHHSSGGGSSTNGSNTITQHYYPESGWGYVVLFTCTLCHILTAGFQLSFGVLWQALLDKFGKELQLFSCWLGAVSLGISLLFSPVWVSICKKKSTRLSAVFGGLVASLGCLFTSFASQFHQTFISYGAFLGIGVGLSRDASSLMVGQYFKRKREQVEIVVVSGSGLGIIIMSISIHSAIGSLGWRLGLQAVTVSLILTFFLGTCYRSASLYHPQRRAILHLKNQKRKVKEKGKREDRPPFIDYSCLRSKTLRIILMSSACTAFGIFTPLLSLAVQCSKTGFEDCSIVLLHVYIGTSWVIGCCTLGLVVVQKSQDCRVSKQYLCQVASVICGISILALTAVKGTNGMVVFSWVYGASLGGYCYSLKVYTYERARARHFPRAWSFLQSSQAIPLFFGVPLTNYANEIIGWKSGYYMSAVAVFIGTFCLFLTDVRRRKLSRRKSQNSSMKTCETTDGGASSPKSKRLSFAFPAEQLGNQQQSRQASDDEDEPGGQIDPSVMIKELTCISEECLHDVDFQDIYFDEWAEYIGECITSCNKVENCLVSEYDPDLAMIVERRARRWSAAKQNLAHLPHPHHSQLQMNPMMGSTAAKGTTGKLTLPGIGTVLEVPLLVAKRLHPGIGLRSQHSHNIHHGSDYPHVHMQQQQHLHRQGDPENTCVGESSDGAVGPNSVKNDNPVNGNTTARIYHHGKGGSRPTNFGMPHFPAIDEDSV